MPGVQASEDRSKKPLHDIISILQDGNLQNILRLAECQLVLGGEDSPIEHVKDFLSKESKSAADVKMIGDDLKQKGENAHAMILYKISHDLHKNEKIFSPDDELKWIKDRINDIYWGIRPLVKSDGRFRDLAIKYVRKFIEEMLKDLREVKNGRPDLKALLEARCLAIIARFQVEIREFKEGIRFAEDGLSIMKQQFGGNVCNHKLYALLLHNLGVAKYSLGRYSDAERCYAAAIQAKGKALDYENGNERQQDITLSKQHLRKTRAMLAKRK